MLLFGRQLEVVRAVALGQDEGMSFGYRVLIVNRVGRGTLRDRPALLGWGAENAAVPFLRKRVVLILVDFAKVVEQGALEGQGHIALKGLLFVHAVGAEAFIADIPPYSEVGFAAKFQQLGNMHQHFGLLLREQDVQYITAEDGVKFAGGSFRGIVRIVAGNVKAFPLQIAYISTVAAAIIEHPTFYFAPLCQPPQWEGSPVALFGGEVGVGVLF